MEITMNDITTYFANATASLTNVFQGKTTSESVFTHIHTHSSALIFPVIGSAWVHCGNEKYFVTPGRVLHVNERDALHLENCGKVDFQFIVVQYDLTNHSEESLYDETFVMRLTSAEVYLDLVVKLLDMQASPGAMAELHRRTVFFQLIQQCIEAARDQQLQSTVVVMDQIVEYIQRHYREKINVTKIAEKYQLERRRLAYLFEKHTGLSPNTYITEYRISKSKELLKRVELSIAEVAERVGYDDCFYFSRVFKKQTGLSPTTYRKKKNISWSKV